MLTGPWAGRQTVGTERLVARTDTGACLSCNSEIRGIENNTGWWLALLRHWQGKLRDLRCSLQAEFQYFVAKTICLALG